MRTTGQVRSHSRKKTKLIPSVLPLSPDWGQMGGTDKGVYPRLPQARTLPHSRGPGGALDTVRRDQQGKSVEPSMQAHLPWSMPSYRLSMFSPLNFCCEDSFRSGQWMAGSSCKVPSSCCLRNPVCWACLGHWPVVSYCTVCLTAPATSSPLPRGFM